MKLADLRRLAIRKQLRIRFDLADNRECLVDEHGTAKVASLKAVPSFNLEEALAVANRFRTEPADQTGSKVSSRTVTRSEIEQMVAQLSPAPVAAADHDE